MASDRPDSPLKRVGFELSEDFTRERGTIWLSGTQAIVRLLLDQHRLDKSRGWNTRGFVSGYRGSPLGGVDVMLSRERAHLDDAGVVFEPGVNEDLAATAVWGTQQVNLFPGATCDGVFGMWYGKAPGLDRSGDVFRHANAAGSSPRGGVLALVGDDPGCKSSTLPSGSAGTLRDVRVPILVPGDLEDLIDLGHFGWGLSRYSGLWAGLLAVTSVMDSSGTVNIDPNRHRFIEPPNDFDPHIRLPDPPNSQEARYPLKLNLAAEFATANKVNRLIANPNQAKLTVFACGKTYTDLREALSLIGLATSDALERAGVRLIKMGMIWPLDQGFIAAHSRDSSAILVVENKSGFLERQLKTALYGSGAPPIWGKQDRAGTPLFNLVGELPTSDITFGLARVFDDASVEIPNRAYINYLRRRREEAEADSLPANLARQPLYCAGCPHSRSTKVPEGSRALAGIGCHYMVQWMDRNTSTFTQMGGEGVTWIGQAPFTEENHLFVNLGDGTYFHSGILAIRAAVAAKVNITFKLLFNDAVAMTGGQAVEGGLTVEDVVAQVQAEQVADVRVVSTDPGRFKRSAFKAVDRKKFDAVSRELREIEGCTVLIYDQPCANELRRRRKRKLAPPPVSRVVINEEVCEGCGDCTAVSNCVAIEPHETELGTKRKINQTSCNQDLTCVEGFCPSFVEIEGTPRQPETRMPEIGEIPDPEPAPDQANILITGVGGTGIVTASQVLSVAAHLEHKNATNLDMTGLAQKGGAVFAHIRVSDAELNRTAIPEGMTDVLLAADLVTATSSETQSFVSAERTRAVASVQMSPTSAFVLRGERMAESSTLFLRLQSKVKHADSVNAEQRVRAALGSSTYANVFLLGYAVQKGLFPLMPSSIEEALRLNGVAVDRNLAAFRLGRSAAAELDVDHAKPAEATNSKMKSLGLQEMISYRADFLQKYQNKAFADKYLHLINRVRDLAQTGQGDGERATLSVAEACFRLLAVKDEYEVGRLLSSPEFKKELRAQFEDGYTLRFHLGPTWLAGKSNKKYRFGPWMMWAFRLLARMKIVRGTFLDVFRFSGERRFEAELRHRFESVLDAVLRKPQTVSLEALADWADLFIQVKGFGHVKEASWDRVRSREEELAHQLLEGTGSQANRRDPRDRLAA